MLRRHIILFIAIRPSDGDVKPGGLLGAFREEQALNRHRVSPSPFISSHTIGCLVQLYRSRSRNSPTLSPPTLLQGRYHLSRANSVADTCTLRQITPRAIFQRCHAFQFRTRFTVRELLSLKELLCTAFY